MLTANLGQFYPLALVGSVNEYTTAGIFEQTLVSSDQFPDTGPPGASGISPGELAVTAAPAVTADPTNQTVSTGTNASFTATASGNPAAPLVQSQVDTGSGFTNLSDGGVYSGSTATTLTITARRSE